MGERWESQSSSTTWLFATDFIVGNSIARVFVVRRFEREIRVIPGTPSPRNCHYLAQPQLAQIDERVIEWS
jgi:hypothetical protein